MSGMLPTLGKTVGKATAEAAGKAIAGSPSKLGVDLSKAGPMTTAAAPSRARGGGPIASLPGGPATDIPQVQQLWESPQQRQPMELPGGIPEFMYLQGVPRMSPQMKGKLLGQLYQR